MRACSSRRARRPMDVARLIHTSPYVFAVVFALASGALALWVDTRFPGLAPGSLRMIIGHGLLSMLATDVAAALLRASADGGYAVRLVALLGLMLPALVYLFVVCVWMMKQFGAALHGSMR